jgi:hypothetical protein
VDGGGAGIHEETDSYMHDELVDYCCSGCIQFSLQFGIYYILHKISKKEVFRQSLKAIHFYCNLSIYFFQNHVTLIIYDIAITRYNAPVFKE